jgi:hypothetical protein
VAPRRERARRPSLCEVVFVHFLDLVCGPGAHADIVLDHEARQFRAIHQDNALAYATHVLAGALADVEVPKKMPLVAPTPSRLPAKLRTSERPTALPSAYRLAWT